MSDMSAATSANGMGTVTPDGLGPPPSPPATRATRAHWRDPRLVVGVGLVAVSVLLGVRLVGRTDDTVGVWAARTSLRAGQPVGPADLVRRQVRFGSQQDADRYLSADAALAGGTTLGRDVGAGELVPRAAVTAGSDEHLTEVPLSTDSGAVPATVRVGSVVDVWVAPDDAPGAGPSSRAGGRATLVFDDVTVVAAPRPPSSLGPSATRQLIVGVTADQGADLPTALAELARGTVLVTRQQR